MVFVSRRLFRTRRAQHELRSPRRWSRFIGLLKWKEFFTLIFYACMAIASFGGALFFGVRSLQGYRKGLTFFYLAMLLFMSLCSLVCHLLLVKWRLDRFFYEFARAKLPRPRRPWSTDAEFAAGHSTSAEESAVSAYAPDDRVSESSANRCFNSRLKAVLKLFHAYAVFLAALVISLLVLFDLATGYTASHFRPTLLSVISLTALQCWVVAISFNWFINVLMFNDSANDFADGEHLFENGRDFPHRPSSPSGRRNRRTRSGSRTRRRRDSTDPDERESGAKRGADLEDGEDKGSNASGKPQHGPTERKETRVVGEQKEDTPLCEFPASDVSTCALATIRGVSSQWGDVEENEGPGTGTENEVENAAVGLQSQEDFNGVSLKPTVIGMPSLAIASTSTRPLAVCGGQEAQMKEYRTVHHARV